VVHRDLDQASLDREYSPSSRIASIDAELDRYAHASAATRGPHAPDVVAYGAGTDETIDLWRPPSAGAAVLAMFHGGYWQALSKRDLSFPAGGLLAAGFGYASIDYSLAPAVSLRHIVAQARAAVAHLVHVLAPSPVVVGGHSAGAHLAACALDVPGVAGGLLVSGVYDLEPIRLSYVGAEIGGLDAATVDELSPIRHVPRVDEPVVIAWAERDTLEFVRQSIELAAAWEDAGNPPARVLEAADRNHFDVLFDLADADRPLGRVVRSLLAGVD
jgi:arylformamidase